MGYYADAEAVKTRIQDSTIARVSQNDGHPIWEGDRERDSTQNPQTLDINKMAPASGANRRSVWSDISPEPYIKPPGSKGHYATFPSDLPRICIQASTSEAGCCPKCGSQWVRVVTSPTGGSTGADWNPSKDQNRLINHMENGAKAWESYEPAQTLGWRATCGCNAGNPVPALVLDLFAGTATTCLAAQRLGRRAVGVDLSIPYLQQAVKRLEAVTLPLVLP